MAECPGHFTLVQYLAGELPAAKGRLLALHLEACGGCQGALETLREQDAEYRTALAPPFESLWQRLRELEQRERSEELAGPAAGADTSPSRRPGKERRLWLWGLGLAAPALVALVVAMLLPWQLPDDRFAPAAGYKFAPATGYKGELSLQVVVLRGKRQFLAHEGALLCSGDRMRLVVTSAKAQRYLRVFSIDGANALTIFYPNEKLSPSRTIGREGANLLLRVAGRHELPGSIVLDQTPGSEHLFVLASAQPFDPQPAERRALALLRRRPRVRLTGSSVTIPGGAVQILRFRKGRCQ